jgi:hypothetical protein
MGSLKIVSNGVHLDGEAYLMDRLVASHIRSRAGKSLTFESARNLTIFARKSDARVANKLFLGNSVLMQSFFSLHAIYFRFLIFTIVD